MMMAGFDTMRGGVLTSSSHGELAMLLSPSQYMVGFHTSSFVCLFFLFRLKCDFGFNN